MTKIEKRLLILWFALAFVVWNGIYDMRMHDTTRGYLLEASLAQAGPGRGVDLRQYMHRGLVDAIAFSTAWSLGIFLAGVTTMRSYQGRRTRDPGPGTQDQGLRDQGPDDAPVNP